MDFKMNNDFFDEFDVLFSEVNSIIAGLRKIGGVLSVERASL